MAMLSLMLHETQRTAEVISARRLRIGLYTARINRLWYGGPWDMMLYCALGTSEAELCFGIELERTRD